MISEELIKNVPYRKSKAKKLVAAAHLRVKSYTMKSFSMGCLLDTLYLTIINKFFMK